MLVVSAVVLATAAPAAAQLDYRNLDDDRPTLTEDAYPIERYAWEAMLPYHFEREAGGAADHVLLAELAHAPARNLHSGVKAPLAIADPGVNVYVVRRWAYIEHMPMVLGIGIAPMLQWIVIPPVVLWLAARHLGFRIRDVPKATGILPDR